MGCSSHQTTFSSLDCLLRNRHSCHVAFSVCVRSKNVMEDCNDWRMQIKHPAVVSGYLSHVSPLTSDVIRSFCNLFVNQAGLKELETFFSNHTSSLFCCPGIRDEAVLILWSKISGVLLNFASDIYYFLSVDLYRNFTAKSCSERGNSVKECFSGFSCSINISVQWSLKVLIFCFLSREATTKLLYLRTQWYDELFLVFF